jgi:hypothetical protein
MHHQPWKLNVCPSVCLSVCLFVCLRPQEVEPSSNEQSFEAKAGTQRFHYHLFPQEVELLTDKRNLEQELDALRARLAGGGGGAAQWEPAPVPVPMHTPGTPLAGVPLDRHPGSDGWGVASGESAAQA